MPKKLKYALLASLIALAACGGDKTKDDANAAKAADPNAISPDEYRKRQQAFADSVLNTTKPSSKVVEQLGKGYKVGSVALRDTIASLAGNTDCFKIGRNTDPYLAGTVSIFAHMAVIGVDLLQVQESGTKWTSAAGNLVNACLSTEMKKWKLDTRYGKPAAYIVQVQFKSDSTFNPVKPDTTTKTKAPAKKKP
ncbi:MAG TPA: hypothetical protein VGQ30_00755 [Gemmatimonadaceae bacterium]|jgi:hypothetical protein|nr:hypothetical protein [Gemmatimonadaceae bacterium]